MIFHFNFLFFTFLFLFFTFPFSSFTVSIFFLFFSVFLKIPKTAPANFDFEQAKRAKNRNLRMSPLKNQ